MNPTPPQNAAEEIARDKVIGQLFDEAHYYIGRFEEYKVQAKHLLRTLPDHAALTKERDDLAARVAKLESALNRLDENICFHGSIGSRSIISAALQPAQPKTENP